MARIKVFDTTTQSWVYADKSFGKNGTTPVKGVDYFTDADKEEFLNDIDAIRYVGQTLTEEQQEQARTNIGAVNKAYLENYAKTEIKSYVDEAILGGAW